MKKSKQLIIYYLAFLLINIPVILTIYSIFSFCVPKYFQAYNEYGIEIPWFLNKIMIGYDLFFIPILIISPILFLLFEIFYKRTNKSFIRKTIHYGFVTISVIFLCFFFFIISVTFLGYLQHVRGMKYYSEENSFDDFANTKDKITIKESKDPEQNNRKQIMVYRGNVRLARFTEVDKDRDGKYEISFGWYFVNDKNVLTTVSLDTQKKVTFETFSYADVVIMFLNEEKDQICIMSKAHNFFEVFNKKESGTFLPASALEREARKNEFIAAWKLLKNTSIPQTITHK